jgi:hypothetical protein
MPEPLKWYEDNADNPPWIKALAEVRRLGCHAFGKLQASLAMYGTLRADVLYEARLTNRENGEHHGCPLEDRWQWPKNFR